MPPEYTSPTYVNAQGATVANPLYEARRYPGWNVPTTESFDQSSTNINDPLKQDVLYDGDGGRQAGGFQNAIQFGVHSYVHCTVIDCPVPDMGAVGYSANDPIFWAHHTNIDRMLDCWTSLGHKTPDTSDYLNQPFSFVDATGNLVTNTVADLTNGKIVFNYVYDRPSDCARSADAKSASTAAAAPAQGTLTAEALDTARVALAKPAVLANAKAHAINAAVTRKRLTLSSSDAMAAPRRFALRESAALPVRTELVLRDIRFDEHPGTQYNVYLERRVGDATRRQRVGTLSFFTSTDGNDHAQHAGTETRIFDVTEELRALAGSSLNVKDVDVVFEATSGRMSSRKRQPQRAATHLTIAEIDLRVTVER
jgi:hypothetical protein